MERKRREINRAGLGAVESHPVEQHHDLLRGRTADRELRELAGAAEATNVHADRVRQHVRRAARLARKLLDPDHAREGRGIVRQLLQRQRCHAGDGCTLARALAQLIRPARLLSPRSRREQHHGERGERGKPGEPAREPATRRSRGCSVAEGAARLGPRPGTHRHASPSRCRRVRETGGRPVFWLPDRSSAEPSQPACASASDSTCARPVARFRRSSPVTATGSRRICTGFPRRSTRRTSSVRSIAPSAAPLARCWESPSTLMFSYGVYRRSGLASTRGRGLLTP